MNVFIILLGLLITFAGYKIIDNRKKFEFNNRTDGGVVQFKNWQATKTHSLLIGLGRITGVIGVITTAIVIFMVIMN